MGFPKNSIIIIFITISVGLLLFHTNNSGLWVTDEAAYTLTLDSLYRTGSLDIWNGNDEIISAEMLPPSSVYVIIGEVYHIYGIPAPAYAFFALPFYHFFQLDGLIVMNIFYFCLSSLLVYFIAKIVFENNKHASIAYFLYVSSTITLQYARISIPHMISVFFLLLSVTLILLFMVGKTRRLILFYSGFFMGLTFAIRYPNIIFLIFTFIALAKLYRIKTSLYFLGGSLLSIFFTFAINQIYYGLFIVSGYGTFWDLIETKLKIVSLGMLTLIGLYFVSTYLIQLPKNSRIKSLKIVVLALIGFSILKPTILFTVLERFFWIYIKLFDLTKLPFEVYETSFLHKKALFQSTPYLIISFFGWLHTKTKQEKTIYWFLTGLALSQIFFYSVVSESVGGADESFGIRYFLEATSLLVIVLIFSLRDWIDKIRKQDKQIFVAVLIVSASILVTYRELNFTRSEILRLYPTILSIVILAVYFRSLPSIEKSRVFIILMALAVSFSISVTYLDASQVNNQKKHISRIWDATDGKIQNESVVIIQDRALFVHAINMKINDPKMRFVNPSKNSFKDTLEILEFYKKINKTIYLFNKKGSNSTGWENNVSYLIKELDYENLLWLNISIRN